MNAFMIFSKVNRSAVAQMYEESNNRIVSKLLGFHWNGLSDKDKEYYRSSSKLAKDAFCKANPGWKYHTNRRMKGQIKRKKTGDKDG